ncbi:MAG: MFS transporter [Acidobacteria bacterium]|nr:MFS transporter [Acidobacteriota bacterium]
MSTTAEERALSPAELIQVEPSIPPTRGLKHAGRAFRHRDFTLFWSGAAISNVGTWMQNAVVPYVLFQLTHSGLWVGLSAFALLAPGVILGPVAGVLADHFSRKRLLLVVQVVLALLALLLWGAWVAGVRSPGAILGIIGLTGMASGVTMPAWQGFINDLVPREDLLSAVTLNSAQFNGSRAFGPALAGLALTAGPAWAFMINAISYLVVIAAVSATRVPPTPKRGGRIQILEPVREGFAYIRTQPTIMAALCTVAAIGFLAQPMNQMIAVMARSVYNVDSRPYGLLLGANGAGAVAGAVIVGIADGRFRRSRAVTVGLSAMAGAVLLLGVSPVWGVGLVAMFLLGMAFMSITAMLMTTVQLTVSEALRGRVMGVWVMTFTAAYPLGSLLQGSLADWIGVRPTILLAGASLIAVATTIGTVPRARAALDHAT